MSNKYNVFRLPEEIIKENKNIKSKILKEQGETGTQTFYFCSLTSNEGTSSIILSLALTMSQYCDYKIMLIDSNYCNKNLSNVLNNREIENLYFVEASSKNDSVLTYFKTLKNTLKQRKNDIELTLIDGVPISQVSDLSELSDYVNGVVLVIESDKNRIEVLTELKAKLEYSGVKFLGTILNKKKKYIPDFIYEKL